MGLGLDIAEDDGENDSEAEDGPGSSEEGYTREDLDKLFEAAGGLSL